MARPSIAEYPRVFNGLEAHELILAVGRLLRTAADDDGASDEYKRSQLLSGYSIARHLAAEEAASGELIAQFRAELLTALQAAGMPVAATTARVASAHTGRELGEAVGELLDGLDEGALRRRLHAVLRAMADREVAALASASG